MIGEEIYRRDFSNGDSKALKLFIRSLVMNTIDVVYHAFDLDETYVHFLSFDSVRVKSK